MTKFHIHLYHKYNTYGLRLHLCLNLANVPRKAKTETRSSYFDRRRT